MKSSLLDSTLLAAFRWKTRHAMTLRDDEATMPAAPQGRAMSLYLHVPFCEVLCPFCSFHRVEYRRETARRYFSALRTELRRYHEAGFVFSSVYVGGGTPTVSPPELVETLHLVRELFPVKEMSVETNPKDLRPDVVEQLKQAGVSRLSVGVQSFDDRLLREMGRFEKYGSSQEIIEHLEAAAPHFATLNVDMIYNLPHQDQASLERDLDVVLGLKANQVSLYPLMTTKSTALKMGQAMGTPDRQRVRAAYETILGKLRPAFAPQSGWCFSRNASAIDEYIVEAEDYVGLGSGAFSYVDGTMYATTFSIHSYIDRIGRGLTGITGKRPLSAGEQMKQTFLMRLFGLKLDKAWVRERYGARFERELWPTVTAFEALGAIVEDETSFRLTDDGMYYWVLMMSAFFESVNAFREQMRLRIKAELEDHADLAPAASPLPR
jgi:coproporphyrinogen III oxidase-like Fe-S oxidoreductase